MMGRSQTSLDERLRREARDLADAHGLPFERVYNCEMEMFRFHAATGGDLDCTCGAHVLPEQPTGGAVNRLRDWPRAPRGPYEDL